MRADQILDCQADLVQRLEDVPLFARFVAGVLGEAHIGQRQFTRAELERNARGMIDVLHGSAKRGLAYRVTPDMSLMIEHVASQLDDTDVFSPDLAPSPAGVVLFERPLPLVDARGRTMLIHWLVWGRALTVDAATGRTMPPSVAAFHFNDHLLQPDVIAEGYIHKRPEIRRIAGRWGFIGANIERPGDTVGSAQLPLPPETAARVLADGDTPSPFTNTTRYLHALWFLLGQTVTSLEDEYVGRAARKRMGRIGLPDRVTVVTLRRGSGNRSEGESLVEWSHRWVVRGHPRWQPYGSSRADHDHELGPVEVELAHSVRRCTHPGCDHRVVRIYIAPYVKGPDDKPIVITDKIYNLSR